MPTITDFEAWLDQADPDGHEEVYSLYKAVADADTFGIYECTKKNDMLFVKAGYIDDTLLLASEKARSAFLSLLVKKYCSGEDIELWYGFQRAMAKDD